MPSKRGSNPETGIQRAIVEIPTAPLYGASSDGHIWSMVKPGRYRGIAGEWRLLHPTRCGSGYLSVTVCADGSRRRRYVHRLIWESFNGAIPAGLEINHVDGDKKNNAVGNLELVTSSENKLHAINHGLLHPPFGSSHHSAKLTEEAVVEIRRRVKAGERIRGLAIEFGLSRESVRQLARGLTWKHVSGGI